MSDRPQFDHGKAHDLVEQLNSAIHVLNEQTNDRVTNAKSLQKNWTGHHADQFFGTEVPRIKKQAADLVTHLQNIISAVQAADAAAVAAEAQWQKDQPQPTAAPPGPAPTPPTPGG
ncbi:MAG: hypothetical protein ACRDTX_22745 [Pseudonocardiaceae bacterium]